MDLRSGDALLVADIQNDFLPGGALGVPHGAPLRLSTPDWMADAWGGDTSTDLRESGKRYQADWLYRFNQNPLDFVPDSAAFVPSPSQNVTEQDVFGITAYMMTFK
jgi:hypothetical protein